LPLNKITLRKLINYLYAETGDNPTMFRWNILHKHFFLFPSIR